jgi:hypothetical protein
MAQKINELELSVQEVGNRFATCECALREYDKKYECESLYADGRIYDAAQHIANTRAENLSHNESVDHWLKGELVHLVLQSYIQSLPPEFTHRCMSRLQEIGDEASSSKKYDKALSAYSTVLSLTPSHPEGVLTGWETDISDIIVKCCKARVGFLEDELINATQV